MCKELGFKGALLIGHVGKLVKIAGGMLNTHSKYGDCRMEIMTANAAAEGLSADKAAQMLECAACDDALRILTEEGLYEQTLQRLMKRIQFILEYRCKEDFEIGAVLFSKEYGLLCQSLNANDLLKKILED